LAAAPPRRPSVFGVNVGGWLCLEDWLFSGDGGRFVDSTASGSTEGQGTCLPPNVPGPWRWASEGHLVKSLVDQQGPEAAMAAFKAHRESFITRADFVDMAALGIKVVRIPMTWAAFADVLAPLDPVAYGSHDPENGMTVIPDAFYGDEVKLVTIPRGWLTEQLRHAADAGVKVLLDLHAFPGGSAQGTSNSIWPLAPVFWTHNTTTKNLTVPLSRVGLGIVEAYIAWIESLDAKAFSAVHGVEIMNEPAHLSSFQHFAEESQVLAWLAAGTDLFRTSTLPRRGIKLYMHVVWTAFADFRVTVKDWWSTSTTAEERSTWAVMSQGFYTAWSSCEGTTSGKHLYGCDADPDSVRSELKTCLERPKDGITALDSVTDGLRAWVEFSAGTFNDASMACSEPELLLMNVEEQMEVFAEANAPEFFWTWHLPFGTKYKETGWSLKQLLRGQDTSPFDCVAPRSSSLED